MKTKILLSAFLLLSCLSNWAQLPSYLPANGLVAWYPFNGNANDESGNGNNGIVNNAQLTVDRFDNPNAAYAFSTSNSYIQLPFTSLQQYTFSIWVYDTNIADTSDFITSTNLYGPTGTNAIYHSINNGFILSTYSIPLTFPYGRGYGISTPLDAVNLNWKHIAITYDGLTIKQFIDGVLSASGSPGVAALGNNIGNILISGIQNSFNGKLDDFGFWNRALTAQEIANLYTAPPPCQSTSGLLNASISQGETYNFNGQSLTTAGTYTATLQNAAGCDSVVTLNLTVEPAVEPLNCEIVASETNICLNEQVNLSTSYSGSVQSNSSATWQLIGNLPEARGSSAGYIDNGKIWIHAGANSVEMRPATMYFDLGTNTGGFSGNIPFPRGEVGYGRVNDKFYVIGGYTGSSASNNTQEYDLANGTWTSKANMPTSRSVLSSAVLNNQIYVLGGWPGTQNTFERYTPESNTWETLPVIPTARHSVNSAAAIDNKVYFLSGKDAWMTQFYNANECFDPSTNSWQTKAPVPQPVYGGAVTSHNGKLYLVGGSTGSYNSYINGSQTIYKTVQIYDPSTDTWTMGPELPVATSLATLISDGVDLYLVGGMSKNDNESQWFISSSIYKLSNTSQTSILWSTGETTPSISVSPTETTTYSVTVTQGGQTCTSEVTITVNQPSAETVNATITEGESYSFNGQSLTTAGTYTATLQNAAGCDSVVTLNLTVNPAPVGGCYASTVINFSQGQRADAANVAAIRSNPEQALGMPEPVVTNVVNFVSLGFGGSITLAFETPIANGAGNDIRIDEATWNNNPCARYPESADVFASQDGSNFVYLGRVCQDAELDLGPLSWAQYVRIVDASDLLSFNADADGYDVNGVSCLNGAATSLNNDGLVACTLQEVVSYQPGTRKNGSAVGAPRNNAANALGMPQNNNTINFVALGFGGVLEARFDYVVFSQPGNELRVTETSFGNPSCNNYPEKARVSVSLDGNTWTELGEICQDGELDLGTLPYAQYIRIQDASPMSSNKFNGSADGFDVDAVVVLNNGCGTSSARLAQMDNTTTPDASMSISAFPNPMEDYTIVNFEGLENDAEFTFQIMDAAGRVIRSNNIRVSTANPTYLFDAPELARGIYQVIIANENGSNIIRLVK